MKESYEQYDVIARLMDAGCALDFLSEKFDQANDYGPARLLALLSQDVFAVANRMDEEKWEPPSKEMLEARRKELQKDRGPDSRAPLKSDDESLAMLKTVFENDEEQAASMKRFIDIAHHYSMKKRDEQLS